MERVYYLDESGNSGDVARPGNRFDFGQQPVFALACIGVEDGPSLDDEIKRLKALHRVRAPELKSGSLREKPEFVADLAEYLRQTRVPVFIEIVEKRFFFCMHLVERMVLPAVGPIDWEPKAIWMKNLFAEHLHRTLPLSVMQDYVRACEEPSLVAVRRATGSLLTFLRERPPRDETAWAMVGFAEEARSDFETLSLADEGAWRSVLPIPDEGLKGRALWMLPNLSSFMNIYARINRCHGQMIDRLALVHDEQLQYGHILQDSKALAETLPSGRSWPFAHADFDFAQRASLTFRPSHDCAGIQAADALAGFVMRYVQSGLVSGHAPQRAPQTQAFHALLCLADAKRGIGLNFVLANRDLEHLGISATRGFRMDFEAPEVAGFPA